MRKTYLGWTAAMVLAAGTLAGCGGGTEDYCNSLEEAQSDFAGLGTDFSSFGDVIDRLRDIGGDAPDEVADDWEIMTNAFDEMEQALDDAGLSFEDVGTLASGETPDGADAEDLAAIQEAFTAMSSDDISTAGDNISAHADEECGVDLDAGSE